MTFIYWDPHQGRYRIRRAYEPEWVEEFKDLIPYRDRKWDKQTKTWLFAERWAAPVQTLCEDWDDDVSFSSRQEQEEAARERTQGSRERTQSFPKLSTADQHAIEFFKSLDLKAVDAAYKSRALRLHPDVGGDNRSMQQLNDAYRVLRALLSKERN